MSFKLVVSGRVQGVSFRASMKDAALRFGVDGWVRNRDDGAVEALVQGEDADVARLLAWARMGPPGAEVISLDRQKIENCPPQRGFHIIIQGSAR